LLCFASFVSFFSSLPCLVSFLAIPRKPITSPHRLSSLPEPQLVSLEARKAWEIRRRSVDSRDRKRERKARQGKGAAGRKGKERKGQARQRNAGKGMAMAGRSVQERGLQLLENVVMTPAGANTFFFVFFVFLRSPAGSCGCGGYL
jgi:hypothetical protein